MTMLKTALASLSLAGLLMAQSAQATTRSSESLPSRGVERVAAPLDAPQQLANDDDGAGGIFWIVGGGAVLFALLEAIKVIDVIGGNYDSDSPG